MITVNFYEQDCVPDEELKFSVIAARYDGKWIFCRHKQRTTWEIPGGHREIGETVLETARRELYEESGAVDFTIVPICVYGVCRDESVRCGMLYTADVRVLGDLPPDSEIGEIMLCEGLPDELTYPDIQPYLFDKVKKSLI